MDHDLGAIISHHIGEADRYSETRSGLFDSYMGEPLGNEVEGRSQAQMSDVFDVVEAVTAELMDMLSSDREIVSFFAESAQDEEGAKNETAACNHVFWDLNDGFDNLQTFIKSGLIQQMGYMRSGWVESEVVEIKEHADLTVSEAMALQAKYEIMPDVDEVEIVELEGVKETEDGLGYDLELDEDGQPQPIRVKVKCTKTTSEYVVEPIPESSVLLTSRWHKASLQDIPFFAIEHTEYTRSDYVAMGFLPEDVAKLSSDSSNEDEEDRHNTQDNDDDEVKGAPEDAVEAVRAYEVFVLADQNEDGIAERLKVWVSTDGKTIMRWEDRTEAVEEVDSIDCSAWTPIKVPFRHVGRSVSEVVDDVQEIGTALLRNTLDSVYSCVIPRSVVNVNAATPETFDDLAKPDHGAPIRVRAPGAIEWRTGQDISGATLPLMEKLNAIKEERTGVTRLNQGMDADTLNKTARGQRMLLTQGQKRLKLIARNAAEGIADIFVRMHNDLRRGNIKRLNFKQGGKWTEATPMKWPTRKRMNVSVGSGNGDKAEKQQTLSFVGNVQRELVANGSDLVNEVNIFDTVDRIVQMGGYPSASLFMADPRSPEYMQAQKAKALQPPEPDPAMVLAQAEAAKARAMADESMASAELKQAQIQLDAVKEANRHTERMAELQNKEIATAAKIQTDAEAQDLAEKAQREKNALERDKLAVDIINSAD